MIRCLSLFLVILKIIYEKRFLCCKLWEKSNDIFWKILGFNIFLFLVYKKYGREFLNSRPYFKCIYMNILGLVLNVEFLLKPVNTSSGIYQFLFPGEEGMAFRTNFYADIVFCGTGRDFVSAHTFYDSFLVFGMDSVFHFLFPPKDSIAHIRYPF